MIIWYITVLYLAALVLAIVFEYRYAPDRNCQCQYTAFKMITAGLYIIIAIAAFGISGNELFYRLLPGLVFCFVGDLFLALGHEIDSNMINPQFKIGIASFAAGHIFLEITFLGLLDWHIGWPALLSLLIMCLTIIFTKLPGYDYGENGRACSVYSFFVGLTAGLGIQLLITGTGDMTGAFLGIGAVLFLISDMLLTLKLFSLQKPKWSGAGVAIFYFAGMWMISAATCIQL